MNLFPLFRSDAGNGFGKAASDVDLRLHHDQVHRNASIGWPSIRGYSKVIQILLASSILRKALEDLESGFKIFICWGVTAFPQRPSNSVPYPRWIEHHMGVGANVYAKKSTKRRKIKPSWILSRCVRLVILAFIAFDDDHHSVQLIITRATKISDF